MERVTKDEIARWMIERVQAEGVLYQEEAVADIEETFGSEWVYLNANGNPAIDQGVLRAFRRLKPDQIEWDKSDKAWGSCS